MPEFAGELPIREPVWSAIASVEQIHRQNRGIDFNLGVARLSLYIVAPNLIRVRFSPTGEFRPRRSWAVTAKDEEWPIVAFDIQETADEVTIETDKIRVCVQRHPCRVQFFDKAGRPFAQDTGLGIGWRQLGTDKSQVACWKRIETEENYYGFGERAGLLNQKGKRFTNWTTDSLDYTMLTDAMYQAIPFFMALRQGVGYGLFFNTTFWSRFDVGVDQPDILRLETLGGELDYYIIYSPKPAEIVQTYTQLTGRMSLPPQWALGYHQCRWSYDSESEVRQLVQQLRQRRIPCDVIHLDIDYMFGYRVFTWNPRRFPDPQKLLSDLAEDGIKVVTIVDPGVKFEPQADYTVYDQGLEKDYFIRRADGKVFHGYVWPGRAVFPDFLRPEVRQWWGDLHRNLTDVGVAGIWNDMNEPAMNDRPFGDEGGQKIFFPMDAPSGPEDERTTYAETHNLYGLMMARACRQAVEKLRERSRTFVLTRSGYAGVQKWSAVWTGDNHSLWEYLEMSLPMLCNLGLSGVAFVGADIGGFAGDATPELFARWMQAGMLYPFMRAHSMINTKRHEPWEFGPQVEAICRQYIELRYRLLPYIYTLFWEAATTGAPILRPLLYHYPEDPKTYELYDQVLLGSSLMAAPVYRPGVEKRLVYLPAGTWYDWWTGESYQGATYILADAPIEKMPIYIRAGSIIPLGPVMQYVGESPLNQLRLRVTPGTGEWTLYEDDGHSFAYRNGVWSTTTYQVYLEDTQVIVEIQARQGQWTPHPRNVIVEVVGKGEQEFPDDGSARRLTFS
ncbi:glycoside hydrolase family 31 protein [Fischerella thermalis]|uniref:Alpha-glucosidase n=1 Tax=Fischerella thermalis CCMEE 5318 TaxID=2019666 RepID=A0A2N6L9Y1_9CYAN|nr:glycoside hydrolase family 31 protein [Fischerella thermalis]PMB19214.1 alpha-glucosidase [Fischerella thermalis CCMEE 5318]